MKINRLFVSVLASLGLAAGANADLRESVSFSLVNSDNADPVVLTANLNGGYPVKQVVVSATLTEQNAATRAYESLVQVRPPNGAPFTLQPFVTDIIDGNVSVTQLTFTLPTAISAAQSSGEWSFRFFESYDDDGVDARWDSLVIQLDDGVAPQAPNLGALNQFPIQVANQLIGAGDVQWYKIVVTEDVSAANNRFLDIDTEGSLVVASNNSNDTEVAIYDDHGRLVVADDDDGSNRSAQMSFGGGTRPPVGNSEAYNGRDGSLKAGVYFIAVTVFNAEFNGGGWDVQPPATGAGSITLNVRTNTGVIECRADYNHSGGVNSQDFFDFLNDFFAGCN